MNKPILTFKYKTMKKFLKWASVVVMLTVALFFGYKYMQYETKKASPEQIVNYKKEGKELSVFYCRPYKKGREIFGGLVPFGKVWRTGANEATTFSSNKYLTIDGKILPAGNYTIWTIPQKDEWTVIFNKKEYSWGVTFSGESPREIEEDALQVKVPVQKSDTSVEQFTISFSDSTDLNMILAWDQTRIAVPMK